MKNIRLTDLIDVATLQRFQDSFSNMTGIAAVITDAEGMPVTRPSCFSHFCMDIVRQSSKGRALCEECDKRGGQRAMETGKPQIYTCHAGLVDFAAPLIVNGRFIGSVMGGQVLGEPPDEKRFRKIAGHLATDPERFLDEVRHIPIVSKKRMDAVAEFLFVQADMLSNLAYNNYMTRLANRELEVSTQQKTDRLTSLEEQYNENRNVLNALAEIHLTVYTVDLETDMYKTVRTPFPDQSTVPLSGPFREIFRQFCQACVHPEDRERLMQAVTQEKLAETLCSRKDFYEIEYRSRFGNNRYEWIRMQVIPLEMRDGAPVRITLVTQNINKRKMQEAREQETLKSACAAANRANAAKSHFLSCMSHDIRTPLNAIIGMNRLAMLSLDNREKLFDCLEKISVSSSQLLHLVNDVLDMSRIESGSLTLTEENFSLPALVETLATQVRPLIEEKKHTLNVDMQGLRHENVYGDSRYLTQIVQNLLSNAIKYTPDNGRIDLSVHENAGAPAGYAHVEITVKDNGYGMSTEMQNRVFNAFERGNDTRINSIQGTGLGLTISKNLVTLMNGEILLESAPGKGSVFTVCLPLKISGKTAPETKTDNATSGKPRRRFPGKRALLVEDNALNNEIATEFIKMTGIAVEHAENGLIAVEKIKHSPPDYYSIVFMDIQMPVMNGLDATRAIRSLPRPDVSALPIVAMTANAFTEDIALTELAGMNRHLAKPVDPETIHAVLESLL